MASNTQTGSSGPDLVAMFKEIADFVQDSLLESLHDFQDYVARPKVRHWLRIIVIVAGYIMLRPAIELMFKKLFERQSEKEEAELKKKRQEEDEQLIAEGLKKPKKDANSLRTGGATVATTSGAKTTSSDGDAQKTVAGEKAAQNTKSKANDAKDDDEYENSDQEDFAEKIRQSGVLEWGRDARKKQKRNAKIEAERKAEIEEEKLLELLDWSDEESGGQQKQK